jgi:broad specificity phosphatase PhoE
MKTTALLMRHGETPQHQPHRFLGRTDVGLSETGKKQAAAWSPVLAELPLAGAWCSDLVRARDTAAMALAGTGLAATAVAGLREIDLGEWEGLTVEEVRSRFPGEYETRMENLALAVAHGGESFLEVQERAWAALQGILAGQADRAGLLLVVAHAGVNRTLICRVLGTPLRSLFDVAQDYCRVSVLDFSPSGAARLAAANLDPAGFAAWAAGREFSG